MRTFGLVVIGAVVAGTVMGCGGGDGAATVNPPTPSPAPAPAPALFTLSGRVAIPQDSAIDLDTADVTTSNGDNDGLARAQSLPNPVTLGGHADRAKDEIDIYAMQLAQGQRIDLAVSEDGLENDLDLVLADRNGNIVASSESTTNIESITVASAGDYLVAVQAFEGRSNYVLTVRQGGRQASAMRHGQRTQSPVIPGDLLVLVAEGAASKVHQQLMAAGLKPSTLVSDTLQVWSLGPDMFWPSALQGLGVVEGRALGPYADVTSRARHDTLQALKRVARLPGVVRVEPNFIVRAAAVPNDPGFADQWHYRLINLPQAWDITVGSSNVVVAVADTGVALGHPDLAGQFDASDADGFDFISNTNNALDGNGRDGSADDPGDDVSGGGSFHGTHVAGTIAAASNNGSGVAGVSWNSRIMPLRVLGRGGSGSSADILAAVRYAAGLDVGGVRAPRAAQILNLSLGCDDCFSASEAEVYRDAISRGLMIAAAAGNSGDAGNPIGFPASYDGVVSVAAVGPAVGSAAPRRATYSQFNRFVDVAAPGGDASLGPARQTTILSTEAEGFASQRRATYGLKQGTSMASPHLAGVMALMKAVLPTLTPAQFDQLLAAGELSNDIGASGRDDQTGFGLIDAAKAVQATARLANGGSVPDRPSLVVQPEQIDFGRSSSTASLEARNGGTGNLSITAVNDDAPWLSVSAGTTQNNRLPLTASVNRSALAVGSYTATITIESSANTVRIPVLLQVGGASPTATAGVHYFLLLNAASYEVLDQVRVVPADGSYALQFNAVPPGDYIVLGGTDSDEDGQVCDGGEACAIYTTPDLPTPVNVRTANINTLNFNTSFDFSTFAQSSGETATGTPLRPAALHWLPVEGLRLKPDAKTASAR